MISSSYECQAHLQHSQRCRFFQTALQCFKVLPGLSLALPGAPRLVVGAPGCSQSYHNQSHGTPVPVIRDPSHSEGWPEFPPPVWHSPDIDASKFTLHIFSDTPGGSQWLKYILLMKLGYVSFGHWNVLSWGDLQRMQLPSDLKFSMGSGETQCVGVCLLSLSNFDISGFSASAGSDMDQQMFRSLLPCWDDSHDCFCYWCDCRCWGYWQSGLTSKSVAQSRICSMLLIYPFFGVNSLILDKSPGHSLLQTIS